MVIDTLADELGLDPEPPELSGIDVEEEEPPVSRSTSSVASSQDTSGSSAAESRVSSAGMYKQATVRRASCQFWKEKEERTKAEQQ